MCVRLRAQTALLFLGVPIRVPLLWMEDWLPATGSRTIAGASEDVLQGQTGAPRRWKLPVLKHIKYRSEFWSLFVPLHNSEPSKAQFHDNVLEN